MPTGVYSRKPFTKEHKENIGKNNCRFWKGKNRSNETVEKIRLNKLITSPKKEDHPMWKGGITPLNKSIRMSSKYRDWRSKVFERDKYTCQTCFVHGTYLEAHHIKSFAHHHELRFDLDNGITLCLGCHKLTDNYKNKAK